MRAMGFAAIALMLAGCTPVPGAETESTSAAAPVSLPPAPQEMPSRIVLDYKSWGVLRQYFDIASDGTGTYRYAEEGGSFYDPVIVTRKVAITREQYAKLVATLAPAYGYAASDRSLSCDMRMTDAPYGTLTFERLSGASELRFDLGCLSEPGKLVYESISDSIAMVRDLTADQPELERTTRSAEME